MVSKLFKMKTNFRYILLLLLITLILFWKVILNPTYILWSPISELISDNYWYHFKYESMDVYGQVPLWNPYTFSGYTFLGNHWSNLLFYTNLVYLFFPATSLYGHIFLLHFFIGGIFVYLFLRKLGIDNFSSFISAVAYILGLRFAYYILAGFTENQITILGLPLIFYLIESYFQSKQDSNVSETSKIKSIFQSKKNLYLVLTAIIFFLQFAGDHNQTFFFTWFGVFLYFIFRVFVKDKEKLNFKGMVKYFGIFFLVSMLIILLSAGQLFPLLEFMNFSIRASGLDYKTASVISVPPHYFIMLLFPEFFGTYIDGSYWGIFGFWIIGTYIGILSLIFVILSIYSVNKHVKFFIFLVIFSALFSMGSYTPVHYIFYKFVPFFSLFRSPARMLILFNFSLVVLIGFGLNVFIYKLKQRNLRFLSKVISVMLIVSIIGLVSAYVLKDAILNVGNNILKNRFENSNVAVNSYEFYQDRILTVYNHIFLDILLFNAFLTVSLIIFRLKIKKFNIKLIKTLIFFVIFLDLAIHALPLVQVKNPSEIYGNNKIVKFLDNDKEFFRVLDLNLHLLPQREILGSNIFKITGYDGLIYYDYYKYISVLGNFTTIPTSALSIKNVFNSNMLDLLNGKYVVSDRILTQSNYKIAYNITSDLYVANGMYYLSDNKLDQPPYEYVGKQNVYVYLNKNYLPRAFFVSNAVVLDRGGVLSRLKENDFNPKETVLLEKKIDKPLANNDSYKEAKIEFYSPNTIKIKINVSDAGFLVLSETWYPGWKAYDNGKEIEILRANYILRSVYISKGVHEIFFIYKPISFKIGLWVSALTFILIIVYFLYYFTRNR